MSGKPTFVYVIYIESSAERVWHALTDAGPDRRVLGPQQRFRLAGRVAVGAPAH